MPITRSQSRKTSAGVTRHEIENRSRSSTNIEHDDTIIYNECLPQSPFEVIQPPAVPVKTSSHTTMKLEHARRLTKARKEQYQQTRRNTVLKPNEKPTRDDGGVTTSHRQAPPSTIKPEPASEDKKIDLSQLASAIADAVRAERLQITSKYLCELPTFNGSHNDWLAFKSAYVDTTNSFSNVENTARFRKALKRKAKENVTRLIANTESSEIIRALEMKFRRPDSICLEILEKLTPTLRYLWFDYTSEQTTEEPGLLKFDKYVEKEIERCGSFAPSELIASEDSHRIIINRSHRTLNTNNRSDRREPNCAICKSSPHRPSDCVTMKNADREARWKLAKRLQLCFRCLHYKSASHQCKARKCNI
ncbi:hypothetical protein EVAR_56747_1 [Eumeta japonica]|uniref:Uncharacterized protein n=1 Tax=Eumeta variegata TaxID=151549 RepID=A0A4C2AAN7_EUMVA|nr:hypothetical protein EVAR_56747_1 [Eumeta japonica]